MSILDKVKYLRHKKSKLYSSFDEFDQWHSFLVSHGFPDIKSFYLVKEAYLKFGFLSYSRYRSAVKAMKKYDIPGFPEYFESILDIDNYKFPSYHEYQGKFEEFQKYGFENYSQYLNKLDILLNYKYPKYQNYKKSHKEIEKYGFKSFEDYQQTISEFREFKFNKYEDYKEHVVRIRELGVPDYSTYSKVKGEITKFDIPDYESFLESIEEIKGFGLPDYESYKSHAPFIRQYEFPDYKSYMKYFKILIKLKIPNYAVYLKFYPDMKKRGFTSYIDYLKAVKLKFDTMDHYLEHREVIEDMLYPDYPTYLDHKDEVEGFKFPSYAIYQKRIKAFKTTDFTSYAAFEEHQKIIERLFRDAGDKLARVGIRNIDDFYSLDQTENNAFCDKCDTMLKTVVSGENLSILYCSKCIRAYTLGDEAYGKYQSWSEKPKSIDTMHHAEDGLVCKKCGTNSVRTVEYPDDFTKTRDNRALNYNRTRQCQNCKAMSS